MKVETNLPAHDLRQVAAAARRAEALGYDGAVSTDGTHDGFLPLLLAAEHTERLELGNAVAIAFPRSPMITAVLAWDLAAFSGGRFNLGLGSQVKGHNERRYSVRWTAPGPRMREYVLCLRAIWDTFQKGSRPSFQGEHYNFTLMIPNFNPGPIATPHVPVMIAAANVYMARLAGEVCDGVRIHPFCSPRYVREVLLPKIEAGLKKGGRSRQEFEVCGEGIIVTGRDQAEVEKNVQATKQRLAFYGSTRTYHPVLEAHGWGETGMRLHRLSVEGKWDEMPKEISDEMVHELTVVGTYDEIVGRIKEQYGGIIDRVRFSIPTDTPEDEERLRQMIRELKQ